jgi:excisionase family DNA binding protein
VTKLAADPLILLSDLRREVETLRGRVDELERSHAPGSSKKWLTLDEAAVQLGCSRDAIRMRVVRGRLEARRQGRRLYVSAQSVQNLR